jgi:hypothetical protein
VFYVSFFASAQEKLHALPAALAAAEEVIRENEEAVVAIEKVFERVAAEEKNGGASKSSDVKSKVCLPLLRLVYFYLDTCSSF